MYTATPKLITDEITPGAVRWRSPSNIALVKYWGKHGDQLPRNPSVSFTLDGAATDTTLHYAARRGDDGTDIELTLTLAGKERPDFTERARRYLGRLSTLYPFLRQLSLRVETQNSFPHSAGIASSASGMSALALCLLSLEERLIAPLPDRESFWRKASYLARLGSGSACRSLYGGAAVWGEIAGLPESSDAYAISIADKLHTTFTNYHDDILLISRSEKAVSSRAGHGLMEQHPYAEVRYAQAGRRSREMLAILRAGEVQDFGKLLESEALTLHALMMMSRPYYTLLAPATLAVVERIRRFRTDTGHPLYFTLDAGPNLHLLYPHAVASEVRDFIRSELLTFCEDGLYLADRMGNGPQELPVNETTAAV